jgi:hypothetical protein
MSQHRSQYKSRARGNQRSGKVVLSRRKPSTPFRNHSEVRYIPSYKEEKRAFLVIRLDPMSALTNPPHTTFQLRQFVRDVQSPRIRRTSVYPVSTYSRIRRRRIRRRRIRHRKLLTYCVRTLRGRDYRTSDSFV